VLAVLLGREMPLAEAVQQLEKITPVCGRMQCFSGGSASLPMVIVDYAHTPDALEKALQAAASQLDFNLDSSSELVCLFGCGGDRDQGKRSEMGAVAERLADRLILTDDNPRHESSDVIVQQILAGMQNPKRATLIANRGRAIKVAIDTAQPDDVVLIAGKGHESYQQIGDLKHPFSDQQQVRQVLFELQHERALDD